MRIGICALAALGAAVAAGPVRAQSGASTILGGPPPSAIRQVPVDTTRLVVAPTLASSQNTFSFVSLFRRITIPGASSTRGISPLPSPGSFPSYRSGRMVGTPPYQLGDPKAAKHPFQPVLPVLP
jgi:hypothetical protein